MKTGGTMAFAELASDLLAEVSVVRAGIQAGLDPDLSGRVEPAAWIKTPPLGWMFMA